MKTALDSNVLLDMLSDDPSFSHDAANALSTGVVAICPIVYTELAASFLGDTEGLDRFLHQAGIYTDPFLPATLHQAAAAWNTYLNSRGRQAQCSHCGHQFAITCPACQKGMNWRQRVMPDFLVGAHALMQADVLLTRDQRTYNAYFPPLVLRSPSEQ